MRKIYALFVLVVLGLVINFIAWFIHTQTLRNAVYNTTIYAAAKGFVVEYKDIKFTNFRAWSVTASIEDIRIKRKSPDFSQEFRLDKIKLTSNPFHKHLTLLIPNHAAVTEENIFGTQEFEIKTRDPKKIVKVALKLFSSVSKFYSGMVDGNIALHTHVKKMNLTLPEVVILDIKNGNQVKASAKAMKLWMHNENIKDGSQSHVRSKIEELALNPDYKIAHQGVQKIHDKGVKMGALSTEANFTISRKEDWLLDVDTFYMHSNMVNIVANKGKVVFYKNSALPDFNFEFAIQNYKQLTNYYITFINSVIAELNFKDPNSKLKSVSEMQLNSLNALLKKISMPTTDKDTIVLAFERDNKGMFVSKKPAMFVLNQLQALFVSNLPVLNVPAPPQPLPKSKN